MINQWIWGYLVFIENHIWSNMCFLSWHAFCCNDILELQLKNLCRISNSGNVDPTPFHLKILLTFQLLGISRRGQLSLGTGDGFFFSPCNSRTTSCNSSSATSKAGGDGKTTAGCCGWFNKKPKWWFDRHFVAMDSMPATLAFTSK